MEQQDLPEDVIAGLGQGWQGWGVHHGPLGSILWEHQSNSAQPKYCFAAAAC